MSAESRVLTRNIYTNLKIFHNHPPPPSYTPRPRIEGGPAECGQVYIRSEGRFWRGLPRPCSSGVRGLPGGGNGAFHTQQMCANVFYDKAQNRPTPRLYRPYASHMDPFHGT